MNDQPPVICTKCAAEIHWLEVFPNNICLACHAHKTEHLTPQQLHSQIVGGFTTNAINNQH